MADERPAAPPSIALRLGSALVLLIALVFPVGVLLALARALSRSPTEALWVFGMFGLAAAVALGARGMRGALDARRHLTHQRRRLAAQLEEAKLRDVDPRDPRRLALEQRFWRDEHHFALARLREPPPAPALGALVRAQFARTGAGFTTMLVTQVLIGLALWIFAGDKAALALGGMMGVGLALGSTMMVFDALRVHHRVRHDRAEHLRERRRLATMAELAGGLSLAAEQPDDLRGAISAEDDARGQLEEVR